MIQDFKDEILNTSAQADNNARYRIKSNNGQILQDDVQIELKTPVTQEGTPLNKATFNNLQGDLYTVDRYNRCTAEAYEDETIIAVPDISADFDYDAVYRVSPYTSMTRAIQDDFYGTHLDSSGSDSYAVSSILDTGSTSYWYGNATTNSWVEISFINPISVRTIDVDIRISDSTFKSCRIMASNDRTNWSEIYTINTLPFSANNLDISKYSNGVLQKYKYYRLEVGTTSSTRCSVYKFCPKTVSGLTKTKYKMASTLSSYENLKKINIICDKPCISEANYEDMGTMVLPKITDYKTINSVGEVWATAVYDTSSARAWYAMDNNSGNYWIGDSDITISNLYIGNLYGWLTGINGWAIAPTKIVVKVENIETSNVFGYNIQANVWEALGTMSKVSETDTQYNRTITLPGGKYYSMFEFAMQRYSSSRGPKIYDVSIEGHVRKGKPIDICYNFITGNRLQIGNLGTIAMDTIAPEQKLQMVYEKNLLQLDTGVVMGSVVAIAAATTYVDLGGKYTSVIITTGETPSASRNVTILLTEDLRLGYIEGTANSSNVTIELINNCTQLRISSTWNRQIAYVAFN